MYDVKVSFLVTYYNQEKYVDKSINSILDINKQYDWEILIGDDGSSDKTIAIVNKYIRQYPEKIKLFIMPREKGKTYDPINRASANRLNLLANASGSYICFIDGDDYYCDKDFLIQALEILEKHKELSLCAFNYQYVKNNQIINNDNSLSEGIVLSSEYVKGAYTHVGACVIRQIYSKSQINNMKSFGSFDDSNIVLSSLNNGNMYYINKIIYSYRQIETSIWNSANEFERRIINAIAYDEGRIYYCNNFPDELKERYYDALAYIWNKRKQYYKLLSNEKTTKYLNRSKELDNSLFYKIIIYNSLHNKEKKNIRSFFYKENIKYKIIHFFLRLYKYFAKK